MNLRSWRLFAGTSEQVHGRYCLKAICTFARVTWPCQIQTDISLPCGEVAPINQDESGPAGVENKNNTEGEQTKLEKGNNSAWKRAGNKGS